jgi:Zn-dependent protease
MRDPMSWSIPVFRAFGIQVRVHIFFFVITLGLFLRQLNLPQYDAVPWFDKFLFTVAILFGTVLLHEFGHCFGARYVGGDAREILIWPLGGLAFVEVPHRWRAWFVTTAAGPAVNVLICVGCAAALLGAGFAPSLLFADPYKAEMTNVHNGRTYNSGAAYLARVYHPGTNREVSGAEFDRVKQEYEKARGKGSFPRVSQTAEFTAAVGEMGYERALLPGWAVWAYRIFYINWALLLFNLLPAYPLDGGKLLQSVVWARTDYRRGVVVAAYTGFAVAVLFLVVSIAGNEALFLGLALFMLFEASRALMQLESEEGPFGYDFSAGYTSLEKDDEAPAAAPRPGPVAGGGRPGGRGRRRPRPRLSSATKSGWTRSWRRSPGAGRVADRRGAAVPAAGERPQAERPIKCTGLLLPSPLAGEGGLFGPPNKPGEG